MAQTDSLLTVVANPTNDTADLNALYKLATTTYRDDLTGAREYARRLATLGDERGFARWSALGYRSVGVFYYMASQVDSFSYYNSLAIARIGDLSSEPKIGVGLLVNKGAIATVNYRLDDAVGDYAAAYELAMSSGYTKDVSKILNNLGVLYRRLNRSRSAERTYQRSLELKRANHDTLGIANTLLNLGRVEIERGKVERGMASLDQAAEYYRQLGMPEELPLVELSRGIGYYRLDDNERAEEIIKKTLSVPGLKLDVNTHANALLGLGSIALEEGRFAEARTHLEKGLPLAEQANVLALTTNFNRALGQTYQKLENPEKAYGHLASYVDTIEHVFQQERLDVHGEMAEKFQSQLRDAEIARQQLVIGQQQQRSLLLWLGIGFLALLSTVVFLLLRSRLEYQKSEALRLETEREAEVKFLRQEAEVSGLRAMIEGQERERKRVAKDLHDGLGGLLATVKARLSNEAPTAEASNQMLDRACTEVRRIAHNMMPQTLALSGLSGSVQDIVAQLNQRGLDTELELIGQPDLRLDEDRQAMLLRILQELTHNVVKHAQATKLFIQLLDQPSQLLLTVEDNGVGFNADFARTNGKGIGLANIESRVAFLGGDIQYDASPGHGTTVSLSVPL